jgi:hypothetical protein
MFFFSNFGKIVFAINEAVRKIYYFINEKRPDEKIVKVSQIYSAG